MTFLKGISVDNTMYLHNDILHAYVSMIFIQFQCLQLDLSIPNIERETFFFQDYNSNLNNDDSDNNADNDLLHD